jgi:hypothetical protein
MLRILIFHDVYVAGFEQREARETCQLLKLLPADVNAERLETLFE